MTFRFLFGCVSVMVGVTLAGCAGPRSASRHPSRVAYGAYLRGLMLERSSQLPEALDAYQAALEHDRHSALLHVRVGAAHLKLGKMDIALASFKKALGL